jgi:uncharacterized phage infection (PIP) family protein YhgE
MGNAAVKPSRSLLEETVDNQLASIDDLADQLAHRDQTILDLRATLKLSADALDASTATIAKQRETLLSDAEWIDNAGSKLRNQDSIIASKDERITSLEETVEILRDQLVGKETIIGNLHSSIAYEQRVARTNEEGWSNDIRAQDVLIDELRATILCLAPVSAPS